MAKKKMQKAEGKCCSEGHGCKCMGGSILVLGILILLNSLYGWLTWGVFIGIIVILKGLIFMFHPKMCK